MFESKKKEIRDILLAKNYDLFINIDYINFAKVLNKINKSEFDEEITEQLFSKMDENNEGYSNLNKFSEVYIEALNSIYSKINQYDDSIEFYNNQISELKNILKGNSKLDEPYESDILLFKLIEIDNYAYTNNPIINLVYGSKVNIKMEFDDFSEGDVKMYFYKKYK